MPRTKPSDDVKHSDARLPAVRHLDIAELEAGLDHIRNAPADGGRLDLIVARPAVDQRKVLSTASCP